MRVPVIAVRARRSLAPALVGLALIVSACGTTVPLASSAQGTTDGLATAPAGAGTVTGTAPGGANGSTTGAAVGPRGAGLGTGDLSSATGATQASPQGDGPTPGSGHGSVGPRGSQSPVVIGVITSGDAGAAIAAFGLDKSFGSQRGQAQTIASYINSHGGLLGHPLKLVYYDYSAGSSDGVNAQAACAAFTEDNHALAAMGVAGMADAFHACAAKRGMLVLSDGDLKSSSFLRKYPTSLLISDMALDRKYRGEVLALKANGFFPPAAKVGILSLDEANDIEAVQRGMKPALASIGVKDPLEIRVSTDAQQQTTQISSAVLRFRSAGVTHIVFARPSAYLFAQDAQAQSYFPKMGVDSRQSPALLMQGSTPQQQLVNTVGIGYQPVQDVDAAHDPGPVSAYESLCKKLYDAAGQGWGTNRLAMGTALYICDELFFVRDAFARSTSLTTQSFLAGVASLGSSYQSPLTFSTRFSASQHDGAMSYRYLRYSTGCSCFAYTTPSRPLP